MRRRVLTIICVLVTFRGATYGQTTPAGAAPSPGEKYASLTSDQKALVDDWMKRFSATIRKPVDPQKAYDNLPVSVKTTFHAVTHALVSTQLTDKAGGKLGPAIQIIGKLDTVAGEVPGGRGDKQFRIYVQLKPDALAVLDKSREFRRTGDNTVYHKGYPICYRSRPGPPSIQVSATTDLTRADVDVDYRSSGFPKALVNGHLSSSNSDVRAGANDETHNHRWLGLNNWWRSLLSAPQAAESQSAGFMETGRIAAEPSARAGMKPADAVFDMLDTWLVKRDVENVMSYFSEQSFACADLELGDIDRGMAKFKIFSALQRANGRFGKVAYLGDISAAGTLKGSGERSKLVQQPYQEQFALYDIREDAAERFKCLNRLDATHISPKAATSKAFGKYYGAVFRLGRKGAAEPTVLATLWAREVNSWKLISYDVDPAWEKYRAPDTAPSPPPPAPTMHAQAPPILVRASTEFLETWLVKRDVDKALDYISAQCIECVKLNSTADQPPPKTAEEARARLKTAMRKLLETTGTVKQLHEAVVAPQPNHADLKLVKHENSRAFALVSLPDYMAAAMDCRKRTAGEPVNFEAPAGRATWGKFYATGFRLTKAGEDSGVLWAVWAEEGSAWKMIAYTVLTP